MVTQSIYRRPVSPARREQYERMRSDILQAARELIVRDGLAGLSMRTLGRAVGVTAPTLYGYFPSKEAVINAVFEDKMEKVSAHMAKEAEGEPDGMPKLVAFARGYRKFALENPDFYLRFICGSEPGTPPTPQQDEAGKDLLLRLGQEVTVAATLGHMPAVDPLKAMTALWAIAHGYISLEMHGCLDLDELTAEQREEAYLWHIQTMLHGLASHHGSTLPSNS